MPIKMKERPRLPFKARIIAEVSLIGASMLACGGDEKAEPTIAPSLVESPVATRIVPTQKAESSQVASIPTASATQSRIEVTPAVTLSPTREANSGQQGNDAVRFGEGFRNWVEVQDSESLRAISEFTILARVKLDGIPPDAIVAKGDKVEAYALFTTIISCLDGSMAIVIDDSNYCSELRVARGKFVNIGVSFKDGKAKFIADEAESKEIVVDTKIPRENGFLAIGASPRGISNEGMSGYIDGLAIIARWQNVQEMRENLALLEKQDAAGIRSKNREVRGVWLFNGDYLDSSGNSNHGKPVGAVSLVSVN